MDIEVKKTKGALDSVVLEIIYINRRKVIRR